MFEALAEFAIFSNPTIRNLWGDTPTKTRTFSIQKKLADEASFYFRPPHKEPLGGVAERGLRGGG